MIKRATAGAFAFGDCEGEWRLGLIEHPRLRRLMIPGGHVEADETQAEAAVREVLEETGREVRLLAAPSPGIPQGFPRTLMSMPWWVTEQKVSADNHLCEPHVHVDHQYVAIADSLDAVQSPAHPFRWVSVDEMDGLRMFEDTRLLARGLFPIIADLAAGSLDVTGVFSTLGGSVG